jgi:hypothetical protein
MVLPRRRRAIRVVSSASSLTLSVMTEAMASIDSTWTRFSRGSMFFDPMTSMPKLLIASAKTSLSDRARMRNVSMFIVIS